MDLNISKAKLTKKGCLEVVYADKEGNDIVFKGINPVHQDLKNSLNELIPYIVDITEQKESQYINWERPESCLEDEFFKKFNVTGVSIGGDSSFEVCVLTGKRTLMTSKVLNLCSPGIGSVYHNRIHGYNSWNAKLLGQFTNEFHHNHWSDGNTMIVTNTFIP